MKLFDKEADGGREKERLPNDEIYTNTQLSQRRRILLDLMGLIFKHSFLDGVSGQFFAFTAVTGINFNPITDRWFANQQIM